MTRQELSAYRDRYDYSCVLLEDERILMTSKEKGITPLYEFLGGLEVLPTGKLELADKIIGRAAAFLAIKLGIRYIHTKILSETALEILNHYEVEVIYQELVPYIYNRKRDGQCPMEEALGQIMELEEALFIIHEFRKKFKAKQ